MNLDLFSTYITNPESLNEHTINELNQIVDEYPYFQTAQILLAKNLHKQKDIKYNQQVKLASIYVANRENLFHLLNTSTDAEIVDNKETVHEDSSLITLDFTNQVFEERSIDEIDDLFFDSNQKILELDTDYSMLEIGDETDVVHEENKQKIVGEEENSLGISEWVNVFSNEEKENPLKSNQDLINDFIKNDPRIAQNTNNQNQYHDVSEDSIKEQDDLITETLAKIYLEQKKYKKAIHVLENLSLKYPEKNIYFAGQIKKIKKLIN